MWILTFSLFCKIHTHEGTHTQDQEASYSIHLFNLLSNSYRLSHNCGPVRVTKTWSLNFKKLTDSCNTPYTVRCIE